MLVLCNRCDSRYKFESHVAIERGGGVSWAAVTVWLHCIRAGSVEKGCGLRPVTSVAVAPPPASQRSAEGGGGVVHMQRMHSCRSAVCLQNPKKQLVLSADGFIVHLLRCLLTAFFLL